MACLLIALAALFHSAAIFTFLIFLAGLRVLTVWRLVAIILAMFGVGGCVIALRDFKARAFLELAARERVTHTLVVPAIYNLCLREPDFARFDLRAWRIGGFGGAPMPEGTIRALAEKLPGLTLMKAYGATETTSPTTIMPPAASGPAPPRAITNFRFVKSVPVRSFGVAPIFALRTASPLYTWSVGSRRVRPR